MRWLERPKNAPADQDIFKTGERVNVRRTFSEVTIDHKYGKQSDGNPFTTIEQCFVHGMENSTASSHQFFLSILEAGDYNGFLGPRRTQLTGQQDKLTAAPLIGQLSLI